MKFVNLLLHSSMVLLGGNPAMSAIYRAADPFDIGAAQASNASTEVYNSAGLTRLEHPELVFSYVYAHQNVDFEGSVTEIVPNISQTGKDNSGFGGWRPAVFVSSPINEHWTVGFSVTSPYGNTNGPSFSDESIVRFSVTKFDLSTINYSGSIAYKFNEKFAVGGGINYQTMKTIMDNVVFVPSTATELGFKNTSNGHGIGWHGGILYSPSEITRFGFSYWSKITQKLHGKSVLTPIDVASNKLQADLIIPPVYTLSWFQILHSQWATNITFSYTQWSQASNLVLRNSALGDVALDGIFGDTMRGTVGLGYQMNACWNFDAFVRYESEAIKQSNRTPLQPGDAVWSVGLGTSINITNKIALKARYIMPFIGNIKIDNTIQNDQILYEGIEKRNGDILGAQLIWDW